MIYIVTPCWNAANTIEQTILSVITQAGDFDITYHIQDGGSTDGTVELVARWKSRIDLGLFPIQCRSIKLTYNSAADFGMYDAIATGFEQEEIDSSAFMAWINADDILMPCALALIDKVGVGFESRHVPWIGGAVNVVRDDISITQFHRATPTGVIADGLCDGQHWDFVQQEGVFFRKWLWDKVNAPDMLRTFKYAGDWNLWRLFANHTEYVHFPCPLGGFRISKAQLSRANYKSYTEEIESVISSDERERRLQTMGEVSAVNKRMLEIQYADVGMSIIEVSALNSVKHHYLKKFKVAPSNSLTSSSESGGKQVLYSAAPRQHARGEDGGFGAGEARVASDSQRKHRIMPDEFDQYTYAKKSHWDLFVKIDESLFGARMDKDVEQLKVYQDLFVLKFIKDNIPPGSRILDVGGGKSRILSYLANTYECWNIDKLEGVGNGPKELGKQSYHLVQDYMGNFNPELPNEYFDLVFSISALEHVPQHDPALFDNIIKDIQRVLKVGGYSLHLFDIVLKEGSFWSNKFTDHIFRSVNTSNKNVGYRTMKADSDLYVMTEAAYDKTWRHSTNKSYKEHGYPSSLNILWVK
ncbi:MAG: methyltransferase domain-containing protein [Gammaproteobacteria bacterium (ex Lamellibrachia satsuma)]|nr:MAG: methyltransferase domain-containing protein [Gammaproteobacteria bacterium (ex Lamellibrachia satsuma)]